MSAFEVQTKHKNLLVDDLQWCFMGERNTGLAFRNRMAAEMAVVYPLCAVAPHRRKVLNI
ncbi:MAG: hypothetical protein WCT06_01750 [Armatimonadota bacterium]